MTQRQALRERQAYNALALSLFGDHQKLADLHKKHGSWDAAYLATHASEDALEKAWNRLAEHETRLMLSTDADFPDVLTEMPWPPHGLYVRGTIPAKKTRIAVVGTRKATAAGLALTRKFSSELASAGIVIVSGMALGIDAAAHEGALEKNGGTIAVLACGLDQFYPRQNERLARRIIASGGAVVSEYPLGSPALPQRFLERNRITSGLCSGTLVIESPLRSGARSTVRYAIEQNREVFVVPGAVTNPNYEGSHELIKSGAKLVTDISDILQELGIEPKIKETLFLDGRFDKLEEKHKIIIQALLERGAAMSAQELADRTALSPEQTAETLTLLMLEDIVTEENGTYLIA